MDCAANATQDLYTKFRVTCVINYLYGLLIGYPK